MAKQFEEGRRRGRAIKASVARMKAHPVYTVATIATKLQRIASEIIEWDRQAGAFGRSLSAEARESLTDAWNMLERLSDEALVAIVDLKAGVKSGRYTPLGGERER